MRQEEAEFGARSLEMAKPNYEVIQDRHTSSAKYFLCLAVISRKGEKTVLSLRVWRMGDWAADSIWGSQHLTAYIPLRRNILLCGTHSTTTTT